MKALKILFALLIIVVTHACTKKTADVEEGASGIAEDTISNHPEQSILDLESDTLGDDQARAEEKRATDLDARAVDFGTPPGN